MTSTKSVSLSYIAEQLGVSKTLVSMVINGNGDKYGISKKTQERVLKLAKDLDYKPNQFARGLRIGKSNTIGLVVSDISNSFYASIARHIEDYCSQQEYNLIICNSDENQEKEIKIINNLINKQVDGLIISSTINETKHLELLNCKGIPFVLIDRIYSDYPCNHVIVDNIQGAKEATSYIIKNGHKNIACFNISPPHISTQVDRYRGYISALEDNRLMFSKKYYKVIPRDDMYNSIHRILKKWRNNISLPTAIFLANNQLTLSLLKVCKDLGISIPGDLSIVSFDDIEVFSFTTPSITSVVQPIEQISQNAVNILLEIIKKTNLSQRDEVFKQISLKTSLVIRNSVKKIKN